MNIKKPIISIIIPGYNHGIYLGRALQSLIDQTFTNWEAIIIDNYSTDNTDEVISYFVDSRIKLIKVNNGGVIAISRNLGIKEAVGEWIAFLDSDDWWDKDKIEICLAGALGSDVIYHKLKYYKISKKSKIIIFGEVYSKDVSNKSYCSLVEDGPVLTTSAILVKKKCVEIVGGFDENINTVGGEDYDLWLRLAKHGFTFSYIDRFLGYYLVGGNHVTSARKALRILNYISDKHFNSEFNLLPDWIHKSTLATHIKLRNYRCALVYLLKIFLQKPFKNTVNIIYLLFKSVGRRWIN